MGNALRIPSWADRRYWTERRGTKRKIEESDTPSKETAAEVPVDIHHTPQRKRMKSTIKYIYQTLFIEGKNSDVTINALGKEWPLHKVYLCQSGYFASMFNGSWIESDQYRISIDIADENITAESLKIALGSLYRDEVFIKPSNVVSILAAATLLQLDGLIQQCVSIMLTSVSPVSVASFHSASWMYGQRQVAEHCLDWLLRNLMHNSHTNEFIKNISPDLMAEVIKHPDLIVISVEMDLYSLLKKWMFLQLNSDWDQNGRLTGDADLFYQTARQESSTFLLQRNEYELFVPAFAGIRWQHVLNDMSSIKILDNDKIIPKEWLQPFYCYQWQKMLHIEQKCDNGPEKIDENVFKTTALRCGRMLPRMGEYCWRWTGYNFGIDLLINCSSKLLSIKRNYLEQKCSGSICMQPKRNIYFRMTVSAVDDYGDTLYSKTTRITSLSLGMDENMYVMSLDREAQFPLAISVNYVLTSPHDSMCLPLFPPTRVNHCHQESQTNPSPDSISPDEYSQVVPLKYSLSPFRKMHKAVQTVTNVDTSCTQTNENKVEGKHVGTQTKKTLFKNLQEAFTEVKVKIECDDSADS